MVKRKQNRDPEDLEDAPVPKFKDIEDSSSDSDDDMDMIDVDFEWFDPQPEVDFHGIKTLLRQLLDVDAQLFNLSALADLILSQPLLGSTVKVDGNESDPYAFLTVLNLHTHRDNQIIKDLTQYLLSKSTISTSLSALPNLLSPTSTAQVGLILTERFINMPAEIVPPMYNMLLEEIAWALEEKEPYEFSHYLILSKTYTEVASRLDEGENPPQKKKKKKDAQQLETFYFHPEDEVLHKHSVGSTNFDYTRQEDEGASDAKRAFQEMGVRPQGHMILIEGGKFEGAVKAISEYLAQSS
ncbi:hypothetical protein K432DRAFT_389886 [Lepidopterella palustris CBS 459.81]|uniref:Protein BCP1 n=1 Tax=Lepidopterella palustris CBS 459.81 TaxID=1314670 RepID=A0A8E2EHR7_9PEZI|nr:hypothetical protein K432DRAFT_389886 [Lepidopterella palustris CBS 459.81]